MGARLIKSCETTGAHDDSDPNRIYLHNWRALKEAPEGLYVITSNFRMYLIPDLTMEQFHEANYCNKTLDVPYSYVRNFLSCETCDGEGNLDWVQIARGTAIPVKMGGFDSLKFNYTRAIQGPVNIMDSFYVSTSVVKRGHGLCPECCGSGLFMADKYLITKTITLG